MRRIYLDLNNPRNALEREIGQLISKTFPINVDSQDLQYGEHPGIKKIQALIESNFTNHKAFNQSWKDFLSILRKKTKKRISDRSVPFEHTFSAELLLDSYEDDFLTRDKKIIVVISMLSDFFTIYGVDETGIKDKENKQVYRAFNVITVSPFGEFEKHFNILLNEIGRYYPGYKFVPFFMTTFIVDGLHTINSFKDECSVYNALFNNRFEFINIPYLRGDRFFGWDKSNIEITLHPPPAT